MIRRSHGRREPREHEVIALGAEHRALAALAELQADRAPSSLRVRIELIGVLSRRRPRPVSRRRRGPLTAAALALAGACAPILLLAGGGAAPSLAEAVSLAVRPPTAHVAEPPDGRLTLPHVSGAGLTFPYWEDRFGWRARGTREDQVGGRTLTTVSYVRGSRSIAYTIVSGAPLPEAGRYGRAVLRDRTWLRSSAVSDRLVVTWQRLGHTCVLSGQGVTTGELLALAAWHGGGTIGY